MWFCLIYALGAALGICAAILDLGRFVGGYSIGGVRVTRAHWLTIAAPLIALIAILMGATAFALKRCRTWARVTFMTIWPLIAIYGIACAFLGAVPWTLGFRAVIDATVVGVFAAWLLFWHKPSRNYFRQKSFR
jgi:hypothetical protein